MKPQSCPKNPKVKLDLKNLAILPSYFYYIFAHLKQNARLRPELSPKVFSTLGPNPARTRPEKPGQTYNSDDTLSKRVYLLSYGAPRVTKLSTNYREPISPEQRISLTLRHLATEESQISLSLQYRNGRQTISKIILETCKATLDALVAKNVNAPSSQED